MNTILKKGLFLMLFITLSSCEDVIKLNLKDTKPRLVIESYIDLKQQKATVLLSMSNGFYDTKPITKVNNASIVLENENGRSYTFSKAGTGRYTSNEKIITQEEGKTWTIKITVKGKTYTASTKTPRFIELDRLSTQKDEYNVKRIVAEWNDNTKTRNFYRLRYVGGGVSYKDDYVLVSNEDANNKQFKIQLPSYFKANSHGSNVKVQLLSLNEAYYNYLRQLANMENSQTPYNPKGNFNNNALGYFGVFSTSEKEIR